MNARKSDYEQTKRKVEEQTRLAWQALQTARQRLDLLENAVNIAAEVFESRKKLREAGKETVINVLDAENEVFSARINYTSAFFDTRQATYQHMKNVKYDFDRLNKDVNRAIKSSLDTIHKDIKRGKLYEDKTKRFIFGNNF